MSGYLNDDHSEQPKSRFNRKVTFLFMLSCSKSSSNRQYTIPFANAAIFLYNFLCFDMFFSNLVTKGLF